MTQHRPIDATRHPLAVGVVGGPTTVIDIAGWRFLSDPTFDPPGEFGPLRKTDAASMTPEEIGDVDVVLVSHDEHADNLDVSGREVALGAPLLFAPDGAAARLGGPAMGLSAWESWTEDDVTVTAVPARHGPADGETNAEGFVNCEVVGFVIEVEGAARVYVSGDTTSLVHVREVHDRFDSIDVAVLHAGMASVPAKFDGRPLSFTAERVAAAAEILQPRLTVVAHQTHWAHFKQGPAHTSAAFRAIGLPLHDAPLGAWAVLEA